MPKPVRGSSFARAFAFAALAAMLVIPASSSDDDGDATDDHGDLEDDDLPDIESSGPDDSPDLDDNSGPGSSSGSADNFEDGSRSGSEGPGSGGSRGSNRGTGSNRGPGSNSGPGNAHSRPNDGELISIEVDDDGERIRAHSLLLIERGNRRTDAPAFAPVAHSETIELAALGLRVTRLTLSVGIDTSDTLQDLRAGNAGDTFAYEHLYSLAGTTVANRNPAVTAAHSASRSAKVPIGLIDTEIELDHPSLSSARIVGKSFHGGLPTRSVHGTAVASLMVDKTPDIAQARRQSLYAADVFEGTVEGDTVASAVSVAQALDWLCRQQVKVVNMSLEGQSNPLLELAIDAAQTCGINIVAAAGNSGPASAPRYPAAYPGVIAVTAVDDKGAVWRRANQGSHIAFAARGVDVFAADRLGTTAKFSGTSYASPTVALALAEILAKPSKTDDALIELSRRAQDAGEPGRDQVYGFGIIGAPHPIICTTAAKVC